MIANIHNFSTLWLLKTLFAPWKRQYVQKEHPGFNFEEWFRVASFNLISRVIGFFVRLLFIVLSLVTEILLLIIGPLVLLLLLIIPIPSLISYNQHQQKEKLKKLIFQAKVAPLAFVMAFIDSKEGIFFCKRIGTTSGEFNKKLIEITKPESIEGFSFNLDNSSQPSSAFNVLAIEWPALNETIKYFNFEPSQVKPILEWFDRGEADRATKQRFWDLANLTNKPGIGVFWSYGYTLNLDRYSSDLSKEQPFASHLIGRSEEVKRIENILSRSGQSNVLLVGDEGVGKKTVVFQLAEDIRSGKVYPTLKFKRILEINLTNLLIEGKTDMEAQTKFAAILEEARWAGNIILYLANLDRFVSTERDRIDLSLVFDRLASDNRLQIIGTTSPELYQKYLLPNPIVNKLFGRVDILPPDKQTALQISLDYILGLEKERKIIFTYQAVKEAVDQSDRYVTEIPFPEKALDLLDEVAVYAERNNQPIVQPRLVDEILSLKTKVPIGQLTENERDKLINLEEVIHRRLINQEQAVIDLAGAMRRARVGVGSEKKPLGVFMFLGPTGVGKTETAKALAEAYFGAEDKMVRFDMNEFQDDGAGIRLLGDFERNQPGVMANKLREHPYGVVLFDEIEKASKQVLNLFLTAFDEGYLTDNFGRNFSLRDMIIVCTSNAGAEMIRQKVTLGLKPNDFKTELIDQLLKQGVYSPEFINRFDSVVVYRPLSEEHLKQVANLLLISLNKRIREKGISVKITDQLLAQIARQGNDPTFGARPMKRLIQDKIEAPLAEKILRNEVRQGEEVEFSLEVPGGN